MPQLGQLHLQLAFMAVGTLGKDVQDQAGAVNHPPPQCTLQVALLHRAQRMVDQDQVGFGGVGSGAHFFQLATADQDRRVGTVNPRGDGGGDAGPGRAGQIDKFFQYILFQLAGMGLDEQGVFAAF